MPIHITEEGKIVYYAYPNGDRVPDFSYCGYQRSEHPIPYIEAKVYVHPPQGDATAVIQRAIDYVSSLPLQDNQFRGAIQLLPGIYHIEGQLLVVLYYVVADAMLQEEQFCKQKDLQKTN